MGSAKTRRYELSLCTQNAKAARAGEVLVRHILLILLIGGIGIQSITSCSPPGSVEEFSLSSSSATRTPSSSSSSIDCSIISSSSAISEDLCSDFDPDAEIEHYGKMKKQFCDERDGKRYVYTQIGEQTWMAENLNYAVCGSKCGDGSRFVDANTENCNKYGRLYDWATAMTICPDGWHLPSDEEWDILVNYVDPNFISYSYYYDGLRGNVAGAKLKAASGWELDHWKYQCIEELAKLKSTSAHIMTDYISCGINGTDDYGFSALPGGHGSSYSDMFYKDYSGCWWSSDVREFNSGSANYRDISHDISYVHEFYTQKTNFFSVRCVKSQED